MWKKLERFELEALIRAGVASGVVILVAMMLVFLVPQEPVLIPVVVTGLLGLLATVVYHFFPRKDQG